MHDSQTVFLRAVSEFLEDRQDKSPEEGRMVIFIAFVEHAHDLHEQLAILLSFAFDVIRKVHILDIGDKQLRVNCQLGHPLLDVVGEETLSDELFSEVANPLTNLRHF